jgi:hypothetical protein
MACSMVVSSDVALGPSDETYVADMNNNRSRVLKP